MIGDHSTSKLDTLLSLMTADECQDVSDIETDFDARKYHLQCTTQVVPQIYQNVLSCHTNLL